MSEAPSETSSEAPPATPSDTDAPPPEAPPEPDVDGTFDTYHGSGSLGRNGRGNGDGRSGPVAARSFDRIPPHSLDAEVSVLGASLLSRTAAIEVSEVLQAADFYRTAHGTVFEAVTELMARGDAVDPVTLLDHLAGTGRLDEVGGANAIHDLVAATPTAANADHYARIVRDKSMLRRLIDAGTDIVRLGFEPTDDPVSSVSEAESIMFRVADDGVRGEASALKDLLNESFQAIEELAERGDEVTGLPTGFTDLDRLTAGFQPQNLIILAARPAMGKCLAGRARITDRRTGSRRRIDEMVTAAGDKPATVSSVDGELRSRSRAVAEFHDNGRAPTFDLVTRLGRVTRATGNHPFLTPTGWRELGDLAPGDLVAVPRIERAEGRDHLARAEAGILGYLLGDGCLRGPAVKLTASLPAIIDEAAAFATAFGQSVTAVSKQGTDAVDLHFVHAHPRVRQADIADATSVAAHVVQRVLAGNGRDGDPQAVVEEAADRLGYTGAHPHNWLRQWLQELGLWGCSSHDKFVPDPVFRAPNDQVAVFLSRLFVTDGSAWVARDHGYFGISYASVSERLVRDVQHLLLRFGIIARIRSRQVAYTTPDGERTRRPAFELEIRDAANVLRFLDDIGIFANEEACRQVRAAALARGERHTDTDLLPVEVWDIVRAAKGDRSWADVSAATGRSRNHNWHVGARRPNRRLVGELAEALDSDELRAWAHSDLYWDEVVSIEERGVEPVYDLTIPELHNFVADDIVVHNSALALSMAHYVTAALNKPVAMFSLEMSKQEIVTRLLASEGMIDSQKLKTGRLDDADWRRLGDALGALSEAPLFIDDTPSINMMEILAKSRRIKQRYGLELVIVDYLQLMQSHRRVDNRQQEVAEISRGLKMMAKELDLPVIALSQLNRSPEARTDKRPMLADLRESGCLTRTTRILRADDGRPVTLGELVDDDVRDIEVWAADPDGRFVPARLTRAFPSGTKEVYRVRMRSGRVVEATANHPFLCLDGWVPLADLEVGSRVAVARRIAEPVDPAPMERDELVLLAHLLGEGTIRSRQPVHYTSADEANLQAVEKAAFRRFGVTARRAADGRSASTTQLYLPAPHHLTHGRRNPVAAWLDELGLWDCRSWEKHLPPEVFGLPEDQVRLFLHHLWATDGTVVLFEPDRSGPAVEVSYSTSSHRLALDIQLLLLRLDIQSRVREVPSTSTRPGHRVEIVGAALQRRFLRRVGVHGSRGKRVGPALDRLHGVGSNPNVDVLPIEVWETVRALLARSPLTTRQFQAQIGTKFCGSALYRSAPSRARLARIATALDSEQLAARATDDLFWDEVRSIDPLGVQEVFDATVDGLHNFVAEGVVLHNSVEQDADIVGFIYRDEMYNEDSDQKGIAELIIAKHRNGDTRTVRLAFLGHVTKFANLARGTGPPRGGQSNGAPPPPDTPI